MLITLGSESNVVTNVLLNYHSGCCLVYISQQNVELELNHVLRCLAKAAPQCWDTDYYNKFNEKPSQITTESR